MVDPVVVRWKFEREAGDLLRNREAFRAQRGWIIEEITFPSIFVLFTVPLPPFTLTLFGVEINMSDYNLYPPSVRFFEPLTRRSLKREELPPAQQVVGNQVHDILIGVHPKTKLPFFCMRGFREYHEHPQHTDDPWDRYRYGSLIGTPYYCLDQIWQYCVKGIQPTMSLALIKRGENVRPDVS